MDTQLYIPGERKNSFSSRHHLDDKFVVAYAGNIEFAQNWDPVIQAARQLVGVPILFLIIGDGNRKEWLKSEINRYDIKNILLLDYQPRELIPEINASADIHTIVMTPELDGDGFSYKWGKGFYLFQ